METTTENKMGTKPVWSLLLTMALPVILSTAAQSLYNIVGFPVQCLQSLTRTAMWLTDGLPWQMRLMLSKDLQQGRLICFV